MNRTLKSLRKERNLHLVVFLLLLLPVASFYWIVLALYIYPVAGFILFATAIYSFFIYPIAGLFQLNYAIGVVLKYKDTKRLRYVYVAFACLALMVVCAILILLRIAVKPTWLLATIFLFVPLALSFWLYWISRNEYKAAQQA